MKNEEYSYSGLGALCQKLVSKLLSPRSHSLISEETGSKTPQSYQNAYVLGAHKMTYILQNLKSLLVLGNGDTRL